jgi:hypothetical protein
MNVALIFEMLKYFAAHTAGFGALAKAIYDAANRDWSAAMTDVFAALAAFGLNLKPQQQANTK